MFVTYTTHKFITYKNMYPETITLKTNNMHKFITHHNINDIYNSISHFYTKHRSLIKTDIPMNQHYTEFKNETNQKERLLAGSFEPQKISYPARKSSN